MAANGYWHRTLWPAQPAFSMFSAPNIIYIQVIKVNIKLYYNVIKVKIKLYYNVNERICNKMVRLSLHVIVITRFSRSSSEYRYVY